MCGCSFDIDKWRWSSSVSLLSAAATITRGGEECTDEKEGENKKNTR